MFSAMVSATAFVVSCSLLDPLDDISNGVRQRDAGSDALADASQTPPAACDPKKPFGTATVITSLSTPGHEVNPRFLPDELTVYLQVAEADGVNHVFTASRPNLGAPFTTPRKVEVLNTDANEGQPSLTADGLTIFFSRWSGVPSAIYTSRRPTLDAAFANPTPLPSFQTGESGPYVVPDGSALYFVALVGGTGEIRRAPKTGTGFGDGVVLSELGSSAGELDPTVTADDLTIYFASFRSTAGTKGLWDIWMATRAKREEPFSNVHPVEELNTLREEYAAWVSPDGCRLYFSSDRVRGDGLHDLYVAERGR